MELGCAEACCRTGRSGVDLCGVGAGSARACGENARAEFLRLRGAAIGAGGGPGARGGTGGQTERSLLVNPMASSVLQKRSSMAYLLPSVSKADKAKWELSQEHQDKPRVVCWIMGRGADLNAEISTRLLQLWWMVDVAPEILKDGLGIQNVDPVVWHPACGILDSQQVPIDTVTCDDNRAALTALVPDKHLKDAVEILHIVDAFFSPPATEAPSEAFGSSAVEGDVEADPSTIWSPSSPSPNHDAGFGDKIAAFCIDADICVLNLVLHDEAKMAHFIADSVPLVEGREVWYVLGIHDCV